VTELGVGVDIGGSHVSAGRVVIRNGEFEIDNPVRLDLSPRVSSVDFIEALRRAITATGDIGQAPIGIAVPGPFDYANGVARYTGVGKFDALFGLDVGYALASELGVSRARLRFIKDADAYASGEWLAGAGDRPDRLVCLTLGTGVGSSFCVRGRPVSSSPGVPEGGDVYHLTVRGAPLEDSVSSRAFEAAYQRRSGDAVAVRELAQLARTGDPTAREVLENGMRDLADALSPALAEFRPDVVVLGGAMSRSGDILLPAFADGLATQLTAPPRLVLSRDPDHAPLIGAVGVDPTEIDQLIGSGPSAKSSK
jgi:glucokinase